MKPLPKFKIRPREVVMTVANRVLMLDSHSDHSYLHDLIAYEDGHYRLIFDLAYFILQPGQTEASKSQWSSLKKKFKRHEPTVFVFKEHGITTDKDQQYGYLDFGFFAQ